MRRDEWMLLTLTFLTGLAIGMYVYIIFAKPTYAPENLSGTEDEASDWSIAGKRRHESDRNGYVYPSFRLLSDGTYVYIPGGNNNEITEPRAGKISRGLVKKLREHDDEVDYYSTPASVSQCLGDDQGFDHEYRVTIDRVVYPLDTCRTALGYGTEYNELLNQVWGEIEGNSDDWRSYDSVADYLEEWINDNFGFFPNDK